MLKLILVLILTVNIIILFPAGSVSASAQAGGRAGGKGIRSSCTAQLRQFAASGCTAWLCGVGGAAPVESEAGH